MKIIIKHYDVEVVCEAPDDAKIGLVAMMISGMLLSIGYTPNQINGVINQKDF